MKLKHIARRKPGHVLGQRGPCRSVVKKITLTAQIGDSIFVSRPDGSGWYDHEELDATDRTQRVLQDLAHPRMDEGHGVQYRAGSAPDDAGRRL